MRCKMKNVLLPYLLIVSLFLFQTLSAEPAGQASSSQPSASEFPKRIVSLAPASTEILFRIGAGSALAARTSLCNYPPEAAEVPSLGGFDGKTFSLERILAFRPDMVYGSVGMHDHLVAPLERYGITVYLSRASTVESVFTEMLEIGSITGNRDRAEAAVADIREQLAAVAERLSPQVRRRVYWEVWNAPYMSAGSGSFLNDIITLAGGINIFADLPQQYPVVSEESILRRNPEVILLPDDAPTIDFAGGRSSGETTSAGITSARPNWQNLAAVKSGAVRRIPADIVSRPGPRLGLAVEAIAAAVYPEIFEGDPLP
jgi:iron complex transport system substrate-binding protein